MPIFYLIEFRLAKGKKKGATGVPSRFWGQKFLKTGYINTDEILRDNLYIFFDRNLSL